jgi:hypothetical protein
VDPQVAWNDLVDACSTGNSEAIEEIASALLTWLDAGGFPPQTIAGRTMVARWNRALAYAACFSALAQCHWKKG